MKKPPLLLTIGTALLLIGGGAGAYWFLSRRLGLSADLPAGIEVIPDEASLVVSVSTDERQWQRLRQLGTPETQAQFDQTLARWRDRLLTTQGYSFQRDIAPWVADEITFALLPPSEVDATESLPPANSLDLQQPLIAVLPIADPLEAQALLGTSESPAETAASTPETAESATASTPTTAETEAIATSEYRGVKVLEFEGEQGDRLWAAVLDAQFIAITTTAAAAETAIDTFKGGESMADLPQYARSFAQVVNAQAFAKFYVNLPVLSESVATSAQPPIPPGSLQLFQDSQGLVGTVEVAADGLRISSLSWLAAGSDRTYTVSNEAAEMPRRLPAETAVMASGGNLQQFWQDYSEGATAGALLPFDPNNLRVGIKTTLGLDVDADLMPWMAGEFALAALPAPSSEQSGSLPVDFVFLVEASDRTAAEATLAQLDQVVADRYRFQVEADKTEGQSITRWTSALQSTTFAHGWLEGNTVFLSMGANATEAVASQAKSLAETAQFQNVITADLSANNGHFFVDLRQIKRLQKDMLPDLSESQQPSVLEAIQTIGVTTAIADERSILYDVYVKLAKGKRPGNLPKTPDAVPSSPQTEASTPTEAEE
ncbi:MAG: DUF3352 domain-containing protein [Leptolyngbya sp. SIO4C5]|nr:DUF3352 domain-containing protein [Leptolyngbya sp. SIO4C5]